MYIYAHIYIYIYIYLYMYRERERERERERQRDPGLDSGYTASGRGLFGGGGADPAPTDASHTYM